MDVNRNEPKRHRGQRLQRWVLLPALAASLFTFWGCGKTTGDGEKTAPRSGPSTVGAEALGAADRKTGAVEKDEQVSNDGQLPSVEVSSLIRRAVEGRSRPGADVERDGDRKPAEVLSFFGVASGMKVADLMAGRGYYADLLARVVGPTGVVYAQNNEFVLKRFAEAPLSERLANPDLSNVVRWNHELDTLGFEPESLDGALMVLFYHDTYWQNVDRDAMNRGIFAALKPGGFFGVIEHVANAGSGDVSKTLHRLDPVTLEKEITAVGFTLEARSDILRHAEDNHTVNVFDDSIRGKTDRVVFRFRKSAPSGPR